MAVAIPWHQRLEARALAGAGLIVGVSLFALTLVTSQLVSNHTIARTESDLAAAQTAFARQVATKADLVAAQTHLITSLPVFRAYMTDQRLVGDRPTMDAMAEMYRQELAATFTIVTDRHGVWRALRDVPSGNAIGRLQPIIAATVRGHSQHELLALDGTLYLLVTEPATFGDEVLATLTAGYALDDAMARELASTTGRDVALLAGNRVSGSSLAADAEAALTTLMNAHSGPFADAGVVSVTKLGSAQFVGASYPLRSTGSLPAPGRLVLLENWAPTQDFIARIETQLLATGGAVFALALGLSLFLSRRMSRPLRELAEAAGEIAQGNWERRLQRRGSAESVAVADAFNDMTVSLSHWHAEAEQRAAQLQTSYDRFYAVTQSVYDAIVSSDASGLINFWHHRAEALFGFVEQEAIGRHFATLLAPECQERYTLALQGMQMGGPAAALTFSAEGVRRDGSQFPIELSLSAWNSGTQLCLTAVIRDVTERHKSEELLRQRDQQLREAQKMDAIGRLASGIAHDFNNSLMVIQGHAEMLLSTLPEDDARGRKKVDVIVQATTGAAGITRRLLTFGRKQVGDTKVIDPRELVAGAQKVLGRLLGDNINVSFSSDGEAGYIRIDPDQLDQVIMNLAINARDAMPDGGDLRFDVRNSGGELTISVTDTGCGMDAETASRIFEPFFTTKEVGRGTGLGLSIVYGIINQSDGHIDLETAPGVGTTFRLRLPRVENPAQAAAPAALASTLLPGTETVLIAEDKPLVRRILRKALESAGYTVLEAENGEQALKIAQTHEGPIHLLLTDVVMPGAGGFATSQSLLAVRPDIRMIFMSGHPPGSQARAQVDASGWPCLQKPFSFDTLSRALRDLLDAERAA